MSTLDSPYLQEAISPLVTFGKWRWSLTYDRKHSGRHEDTHCRTLSSKHDAAINFFGLSATEIDYPKETCVRLDPVMLPIGGQCSEDPVHTGGYIGRYQFLGSWKDVFFSCVAACVLFILCK